MKKIIQLQDIRTWKADFKKCIKENYIDENSINNYNIMGYHYTNLVDINDIFKDGIIGLKIECINNIKRNICKIYPKKSELIDKKFEEYIKKNNYDNRKCRTYFCCDKKQFNDGFNYIFEYYGGEISYNVFNNKELGKHLLLNIGKPYIVKFRYRFNELDEYIKYDLKQKMKEKLLNRKNISMDLYIEKEINTKDILGIYEVKKINEYYYITNFIKNENFKDE